MSLPPSSSPVRRQPLVNQVLEHLQQQISSGAFPIGSKLPPEPELMAHLAVGRSTVREAMRVLTHMGLVDVRPGDGSYVRALAPENESLGQRLRRARVVEVFEVRRALEMECVRLAALHHDEHDVERFRKALNERRTFLAPGHKEEFIDADLAFHIAVADATKNTVLADLYQAFVNVNREGWSKASEVPGLNEEGQVVHEKLAEAIVAGQPERAQKLLGKILDHSTGRFREVLHQEHEASGEEAPGENKR